MSPVTLQRPERTHVLSLAYGYLGSLADSEDIVQEAMLRFEKESGNAEIRNPAAWLTTVVSRLSIDKLRSAQHRREVYPGEWLPEPVFDAPSPEQEAITHSRLSVALLYLLEKLEPEQRIVFVLREVFEHTYETIAGVVGKSEPSCRQLMVRARAALERSRQSPPARGDIAQSVVKRFIQALSLGDANQLLGILAPDAVLIGDGGGKVQSVINPIFGAERIARFFMGIRRKPDHGLEVFPAEVNSGAGMLTYRDGQLISVASLSIENGQITGIYSVGNPDKIHGAHQRPE
jgi:RNA polymerase sigma-70 factor (ECF subfamily)